MDLTSIQKPLKDQYRSDPASSRITLKARGGQTETPIACSVAEVFPPSEIEDWTDDDDTALCPKCGIDSVIGSVSGYPIERQFLQKMHDHWF